MTGISRRQFLRGNFSAKKAAIRPPWALAEAAFVSACTRCCDCVNACPQHILVIDGNGQPTVDFGRGECTFCGECAEACLPRALYRKESEAPWRLKAHIENNCLARNNVVCRACGDACPVQAIRFRPNIMAAAQPEIEAVICNGCGACYAPCPANAIRLA